MLQQNNISTESSNPLQIIHKESPNNSYDFAGFHNLQNFEGFSHDFDTHWPTANDRHFNIGMNEGYQAIPSLNSVCGQLYSANESGLLNQNLHQDMTLSTQQCGYPYDVYSQLALASMNLSGYCLCGLNGSVNMNGLNSYCTTSSKHEKSSEQRKTRCTPKTESESTTLKGYRFRFRHETINGRKRKIIQCQYDGCSKEFTKTWSFLYHARMHEGEKPFECNICERKFSQKSNLTKHMKHHMLTTISQRKLFKCRLCPKGYTERYNLRKHLKAVHRITTNRDLTLTGHQPASN
ncbi:unnamed protein product [Moneuplotes crassus]|uniref:C2H2-type domain-containing protein n=1 Tax=Euplotes crassus TaxID=5936 RepID=A0AAD1Y6C1_EUPCR|nr:unnamed protein product [Moneuplotes crassus]